MPPEQVSLNTLYEKVGEVGAIAREAKHAAKNAETKIDALALIVTTQGHLREDVERLTSHVKDQESEIDILKADKLRREGALGLFNWCARNWPLTLVLTGLGVLVAWANGKIG
jgi:hypothetical protein